MSPRLLIRIAVGALILVFVTLPGQPIDVQLAGGRDDSARVAGAAAAAKPSRSARPSRSPQPTRSPKPGRTVTPSPTPSSTPTPTPTPSPTAAPTLSATPAPPTPGPTAAPTPVPGGTYVLVGAGDIASCSNDGDEATAELLDTISGTVFTAGDNVYSDGTQSEFADCYDPSWGRHRTRTLPAPGNHDYHTSGAAGYFGYFGANAGPSGLGYYAYDLGAWRVYSLNSEVISAGQVDWLRADIAANPRSCIAAYWHHPRYSSGQHGNDPDVQPFWDALVGAGAELVINGHDHDYERFAPIDGIREVVVGTGGAGLRGFGAPQPGSEVRNFDTNGVLQLSLSPTGYVGQFVPAGGGSFSDSFSGSCSS